MRWIIGIGVVVIVLVGFIVWLVSAIKVEEMQYSDFVDDEPYKLVPAKAQSHGMFLWRTVEDIVEILKTPSKEGRPAAVVIAERGPAGLERELRQQLDEATIVLRTVAAAGDLSVSFDVKDDTGKPIPEVCTRLVLKFDTTNQLVEYLIGWVVSDWHTTFHLEGECRGFTYPVVEYRIMKGRRVCFAHVSHFTPHTAETLDVDGLKPGLDFRAFERSKYPATGLGYGEAIELLKKVGASQADADTALRSAKAAAAALNR